MPSKAYEKFLINMDDSSDAIAMIDRFKTTTINLKEIFKERYSQTDYTDFMLRGAIVTLCAARERYNEDLLIEGIVFYGQHFNKKLISDSLNKDLLKRIAEKQKINIVDINNEIIVKCLIGYTIDKTDNMHTPTSSNLDRLFKIAGINNYSKNYRISKNITDINEFVKKRGSIAHNGKSSGIQISLDYLKEIHDIIIDNTIQIDSQIHSEILTKTGKEPWKEAEYYRQSGKILRIIHLLQKK